MNVMSADTRSQVTEAAVMESLAENKYVQKNCKNGNSATFGEILRSSDPSTEDANMQILRSYVNSHSGAENFVVEDCSSFPGGKGYGHSVFVRAGENVYVGFNGTEPNEWVDDGDGLWQASTPQQEAATAIFDDYVNRYGLTVRDNVIVTGHSKGGNKAMYVTMTSDNAYLIDGCVALDGQGFSQEAIDEWHRQYNGTSEYQERSGKILLVSGQNDYVHELGLSIVDPNNRYIVDYQEKSLIGKNPGEIVGSMHGHEYLFDQKWNPQTGRYEFTANLNRDSYPGPIEAVLNQFMNQYMKLSREDRENSAPAVMKFFQKANGGKVDEITKEDLDGIFMALLQTNLGSSLIGMLSSIISMMAPYLAPWVMLYFLSLLTRVIGKRIKGEESDTVQSVGDGSKEILLNQELFWDLKSNFDIVFDKASEAAQYAEKAESLQHDLNICGALTRTVNYKSERIREIMRVVVDSFSTTDKTLASEARKIGESYLGSEIYRMT